MECVSAKSWLTPTQKEQVTRWWLPHLVAVLKKQYTVPVLHFWNLSVPVSHAWLRFRGGTCFPLRAGDDSWGFLIVMVVLEKKQAQKTRHLLDHFLQKTVSTVLLELEESPVKNVPKKHLHSIINKAPQTKPMDQSRRTHKACHKSRPFLIQHAQETYIQKQAYELYLKSSFVAFLLASELLWHENLFQQLDGVFVCVPSFYNLLLNQQNILKQALKKPLSCGLVLGIKTQEKLSSEIKKLLYPFPNKI